MTKKKKRKNLIEKHKKKENWKLCEYIKKEKDSKGLYIQYDTHWCEIIIKKIKLMK